jgi:hypothetical protein
MHLDRTRERGELTMAQRDETFVGRVRFIGLSVSSVATLVIAPSIAFAGANSTVGATLLWSGTGCVEPSGGLYVVTASGGDGTNVCAVKNFAYVNGATAYSGNGAYCGATPTSASVKVDQYNSTTFALVGNKCSGSSVAWGTAQSTCSFMVGSCTWTGYGKGQN